MLKKITAMVLALVLILSMFAGCGRYKPSKDMTVLGDTKSWDPLRICIDMEQYAAADPFWTDAAWNDFLFRVQETAGIEDVVLEIIPPAYDWMQIKANATERKAALSRLRVEIMAGEGPDVFLMRYSPDFGFTGYDYDGTEFLFKHPKKAMENGLFLPLDEYVANAELADWDQLTQAVLDAGRNEEGLQLVPLSYTFPLLCYPKSEWEHTPDKTYTWNDMLTNSELMPYSLDLANSGAIVKSIPVSASGDFGASVTEWVSYSDYLEYILGDLADYDEEELRFTEEELLARVNEILSLEQEDQYTDVETAKEEYVGYGLSERTFNKPMTFLPLYSVNGGITVNIKYFAAVNRNTKRPEDAFKVIDLLMNKHVQRWGDIYNSVIDGLPLNEELFQATDPLCRDNYYMTAENFEAFCQVRDQITDANFESELTTILYEMMMRCHNLEHYEMTVEEIVHEAYVDMQRRVRE